MINIVNICNRTMNTIVKRSLPFNEACTKITKPMLTSKFVLQHTPIIDDKHISANLHIPKEIIISGTTAEWRNVHGSHKLRHDLATKKYQLFPESTPAREISNNYSFIVNSIQHESDIYCSVNKKLHLGIKLSPEERAFYDKVIASMDTLNKNQFVLRYITPYNGLENEIQNGILNFRGLTSCTTDNSHFFMRWGETSYIEETIGSRIKIKPSYLLKINLFSGQKILNCNVNGSRLNSEVVLPEGRGIIKKIDNALKYIEVDFLSN